MKSIKLVIRV